MALAGAAGLRLKAHHLAGPQGDACGRGDPADLQAVLLDLQGQVAVGDALRPSYAAVPAGQPSCSGMTALDTAVALLRSPVTGLIGRQPSTSLNCMDRATHFGGHALKLGLKGCTVWVIFLGRLCAPLGARGCRGGWGEQGSVWAVLQARTASACTHAAGCAAEVAQKQSWGSWAKTMTLFWLRRWDQTQPSKLLAAQLQLRSCGA